jgi:tyrosine-protein kinase Etk/Wzc
MVARPDLDFLLLLSRRWRTIALCGAIGLTVAVGYGFGAPSWYEARLAVVPSQRSKDIAMALPADLSALGGISTPMWNDQQRIHAVLTSQSVADAVIEKFELKSRYDTTYIERARERLWSHCSVLLDRKTVIVELSCEDKDPERVRQMADYFGEVGNRIFGRISVTSASEERRFLESQVVRARQEVDTASQKLRTFQETYRIIDLAEQSKAVISAMASLQGQLLSKQLELDYISGFSASTEASVVQLRDQIAVLEAQLASLEAARATRTASPAGASPPNGAASSARLAPRKGAKRSIKARENSFFPGAMDVPALRIELEQLFRQQKVQETVFLLLTQRLAMARVDEARNTSTFQILDRPTTPTYRSRPRRTKIAGLGVFLGLAGACVWILGPTWWRRRRAMSRQEG